MRAVYSSDGAGAASGGGAGSRPGVSSVEVFGFVGWITSSVAYVLYMLWAYTPASVLESYGITYYPSKYWAIALPAWVCVTVVFVYWVYESLCMMAAPPPGGPHTLRDYASKTKQDVGMPSYFTGGGGSIAIPPLADIPPALVSMVLHGGATPQEAEELYDRGQRQRQRQRRRFQGTSIKHTAAL